jgi:lipopolysaccharide transport system ATP-binding protein
MSSKDIAIRVQGLGKCYEIYADPRDRLKQFVVPHLQMLVGRSAKKYFREFWALKDVSFEIKKGETVGIIGRNGSGKSTLLQMICGTLNPTTGSIQTNGRIAALLELGAGFNHEFTGRENVYLNASLLGLSDKEIEACFQSIIDFADIGDALEQPIKTYSSGMVVRLAFAVAVHTNPDILIVDEALAVGDMVFQARCLDHIKSMRDKGVTTIFVTHDIGTFQTICNYGLLLDEGNLFSQGQPDHLAAQYYNLAQEHENQRQKKISGHQELNEAVVLSLKEAKEKISKVEGGKEEYRFGSNGAIIADFRILNEYGQVIQALEVGKSFTIEMDVDVRATLNDLTAAIMFRNAQGQNLFGANTRYDSQLQIKSVSAGSLVRIGMTMNMLLNPGQYLLHLGLADCSSDHLYVTLDNRDKAEAISVFGKPISFGVIHHNPEFTVKSI